MRSKKSELLDFATAIWCDKWWKLDGKQTIIICFLEEFVSSCNIIIQYFDQENFNPQF